MPILILIKNGENTIWGHITSDNCTFNWVRVKRFSHQITCCIWSPRSVASSKNLTKTSVKRNQFVAEKSSTSTFVELRWIVYGCRVGKIIIQYLFDRRSLGKKCPYSELFWSVFSCIWTEYLRLRISPYSVQMQENTDQNNSAYGQILRSGFSYVQGFLWNNTYLKENYYKMAKNRLGTVILIITALLIY